MSSPRLPALCLLALAPAITYAAPAPMPPAAFNTQVRPLLEAHCTDCHGEDVQKGGLRLDNLATDFQDEKLAAKWTHILDKITSGEMPPEKQERPPELVSTAATTYLRSQLHAVSLTRQQKYGRVTLRRLNGREYENTLNDLLGTKLSLKDMLPEDATTAGFDNVSSGLDLSAYNTLFAGVPLKPRSVAKAESTAAKVPKIPENRSEFQWNNDPLVPVSSNPKEDAIRLLRTFLPRAFRRPVDDATAQHYVQKVHRRLDEGASFLDAMSYGYKLILSSPDFLFLDSAPAAAPTPEGTLPSTRLDDYALAERLSYFLWSSLPDEELLTLAASRKLSNPDVLHAQVERLLNSPKAARFTENFAGQWLDLRKIDFTIPDPQLYSDFDNLLLWAMPLETQAFFDEVLRHNLSLLNFVDSDWSMLNERLAALYGIPGVNGSTLRKVKLPAESRRGGVMTQASVLKVTADGTRTSPILRGKWVLERIIGKPPSPPPPDIPAIEPDIRGATTIRQQLDLHRNSTACASCHVHIDPPGFALENYDPIGNWRDFYRVTTRTKAGAVNLPYTSRAVYRGPDVEKGSVTHEGRAFNDITDYKKILLEDKDQLARSLTHKLIIYATGADIQFADREVTEQIIAKIRPTHYGLRDLVHEITQSRVFLNK